MKREINVCIFNIMEVKLVKQYVLLISNHLCWHVVFF